MTRHNAIQTAYKKLGKEASFYDGMMTCSTILGTGISKLVWSIGKVKKYRLYRKSPVRHS